MILLRPKKKYRKEILRAVIDEVLGGRIYFYKLGKVCWKRHLVELIIVV